MAFINTNIDKIFELLTKHKEMSIKELAKKVGYNLDIVEEIGLIFEKQGLVKMIYPVVGYPKMKLLKILKTKDNKKNGGKIIDQYDIVSDRIVIHIDIAINEKTKQKKYFLDFQKLGAYTDAFLDTLREDISDKISLKFVDIMDKEKLSKLKNSFFIIVRKNLDKYFKDNYNLKVISAELLHRMYGLGKIEILLKDDNIEEIAINSSKTEVCVYHKVYGWLRTNILPASEQLIANYAEQIGRKVGREINILNPILEAHLSGGNRVTATLNPISNFGNTLTIRKYATRPWTVVDFIGKQKTMNTEMAAILWLAMQYELNMLVAGGTASGKTSTLNAFCAFIPSSNRIISIEDVREIMLPRHLDWNWIPLLTKTANQEGLGKVTMLDLINTSLRMRPDRIIVGEIRRQREAEVLFEAMQTGHSTYSTMHANSSKQVVRRLTEKPINLPTLEIEAIDLLLVQYRDRCKNLRRTYELAEIESGINNDQLDINVVYKWSPRDDTFDNISAPTKFMRQLNLYTGLTESEIKDEIKNRAIILEWMNKHGLNDIDNVGKVIQSFYSNPKLVSNIAKKDKEPKELFE